MYRLFERGNLEENRIASDLRNIGCKVHLHNPLGFKHQQFAVSALNGHFRGHLDGCVLGIPEAPKTWHVLEIKTHNAKSFAKLKSEGVQLTKPMHWIQCQVYMHLTGMTRTLYMGVNKDTEELYAERLKYDKDIGEATIVRAYEIIQATEPPPGISDRRDFWECKFCDARDICHGAGPPLPALHVPSLSCCQCCHATPIMEGEDGYWKCELKGGALPIDGPCKQHLTLPGLIPVCEAKDFRDNSILFSSEVFGDWWHGNDPGQYTSEELTKLPLPLLTDDMIATAKEQFHATVTEASEDILERYTLSPQKSRVVWNGQLDSAAISAAWLAAYGVSLTCSEQIGKCNFPTHSVAEYAGNRIIVAYPLKGKAEIRDYENVTF